MAAIYGMTKGSHREKSGLKNWDRFLFFVTPESDLSYLRLSQHAKSLLTTLKGTGLGLAFTLSQLGLADKGRSGIGQGKM